MTCLSSTLSSEAVIGSSNRAMPRVAIGATLKKIIATPAFGKAAFTALCAVVMGVGFFMMGG
jgi:hypothetical protein